MQWFYITPFNKRENLIWLTLSDVPRLIPNTLFYKDQENRKTTLKWFAMNKLEIIPVARSLFRAYELHCTYIIDFYILPLTRFNSTAPIISCTVAAILGKRSIPLRAYITSASLAAKVKKNTMRLASPNLVVYQVSHCISCNTNSP